MQFGYSTMNSAAGVPPSELGPELEDRGFESMWVPEHSHIRRPGRRRTRRRIRFRTATCT